MTTVYYKENGEIHQEHRIRRRLLGLLNRANPNRDTTIWCGILRDILSQTNRGRFYRDKLWHPSGQEPVELIDYVCNELIEELQNHEQMPLFSAALLQELGGSR